MNGMKGCKSFKDSFKARAKTSGFGIFLSATVFPPRKKSDFFWDPKSDFEDGGHCPKTNLAAFQILLQNFFPAITCSSDHFISCPPMACQISPKRVASAPYLFIRSIGSIPVPKDLDILSPDFAKIVA